MTDSLERLLRLEAIAEIQRLAADYAHGADNRDLPRFLAVWHPEAVWDVGVARFVGPDEIAAAIERQWVSQPRMHHWTTNHAIDVDVAAGRASGVCDVAAWTVLTDGRELFSAGTYRDRYARHDGRWVIVARRAEVHGSREVPDAPQGVLDPQQGSSGHRA